jgi:hypothetical protein
MTVRALKVVARRPTAVLLPIEPKIHADFRIADFKT